MADEDIQHEQEDVAPTLEDKARDRGWRPQDEWEGDPDVWVDAKEFMFRGELMDTIHSGNRKIKQQDQELDDLKKTMQELHKHYEQMAKTEIEAKVKALKQAKVEALDARDTEAVVEIDEQLSEIRQQTKKIEEQPQAGPTPSEQGKPTLPIEIQEWIHSNPWADEASTKFNSEMAEEAMALVDIEVRRTGDRSVATLNKVKTKLQKMYPDQFPGSRTRASGSVDTEGSGRGAPSSRLSSKLNDLQRDIGKRFVKAGAFASLEDYAKDLQKLGEL